MTQRRFTYVVMTPVVVIYNRLHHACNNFIFLMYVINCSTVTPIVLKCLQVSLLSFPTYRSPFSSHTNSVTASKNVNITSAFIQCKGPDPVLVGPCHHGMARPRILDRGTASDKEGSCE
jgi:hypothetical protein